MMWSTYNAYCMIHMRADPHFQDKKLVVFTDWFIILYHGMDNVCCVEWIALLLILDIAIILGKILGE